MKIKLFFISLIFLLLSCNLQHNIIIIEKEINIIKIKKSNLIILTESEKIVLSYLPKNFNNKKEFCTEFTKGCDSLQINPLDLCSIIYTECKFKNKINPYTSAVGLIQFMPSTLKWLGYTTEQVFYMSPLEQLKVIFLYYSKSKYKLDTKEKLYAFTFYPYLLQVWDKNEYIIGSESGKEKIICRQNKPMDLNNDGIIKLDEYKLFIHQTK